MASDLRRYSHAFQAAQRLLARLGADCFPVDILALIARIEDVRILVCTSAEYTAWRGGRAGQPVSVRDAKCFFDPGRGMHLIVYNERAAAARVRFSLAHELGHILLGHLNDCRTEVSRGGLEDAVYHSFEGAANTFAGNLLAPPILVDYWQRGSPPLLDRTAVLFGLSRQAVREYRAPDYRLWLEGTPTEDEAVILVNYRKTTVTLQCSNCGGVSGGLPARFCPYCGQAGPNPREAMDVIYEGIPTDDAGRARLCPRCGNGQLGGDGRFCMVCGGPVVNSCADTDFWGETRPACRQGVILPGFARCCPHCGNDSEFVRQGYLSKWDEANLLPI